MCRNVEVSYKQVECCINEVRLFLDSDLVCLIKLVTKEAFLQYLTRE